VVFWSTSVTRNVRHMKTTLLVVCVSFIVAINAQVNRPGDCYSLTDTDSCVAVNNERPINSSSVHCLWCHSHHKGHHAKSHCAAHTHIEQNNLYHHNWVCDYRMPSNLAPHWEYGKHNRTRHPSPVRNHGRRLLNDGANQITQFLENEVANWPPAAQIIAGVVYGALGNLPNDLNTCLTDAEQLFTDLENTFNNWEWTWQLDVIMPELDQAFTDVEEAVDTFKACSSALSDAKSDVTKILSIIKGTTGPFGWLVEAGEIAWNSVNIYQDINSAINNFQNGNYFDCGYNMGAIVYILV